MQLTLKISSRKAMPSLVDEQGNDVFVALASQGLPVSRVSIVAAPRNNSVVLTCLVDDLNVEFPSDIADVVKENVDA